MTMTADEIDAIRLKALRALGSIQPASVESVAEPNVVFGAQRTDAGRSLPPYYVVYFLLVDLLGFRNLGRFEKVDWSVPVDYQGKVFLVEHRKFGLGIFCVDPSANEDGATYIRNRITKACQAARPYFQHVAKQAMENGHLTVHNNHAQLFGRLQDLLGRYRAALKAEEKAIRKPPVVKHFPHGGMSSSWKHRTVASNRVAWLAQGVIEAFFSWSEHSLIHLAVIDGRVEDGPSLLKITMGEWKEKYKLALDVAEQHWKAHYDVLIQVRNEHRNFTAHGAFGKDGQAFSFHSSAGAVPLSLADDDSGQPTFVPRPTLSDRDAVAAIEAWIADFQRLKTPQWMYLESTLGSILTFRKEYALATSSVEEMSQFIDHMERMVDDSANMDW